MSAETSGNGGYPPHHYPHPEWEKELISRPGPDGTWAYDGPTDHTHEVPELEREIGGWRPDGDPGDDVAPEADGPDDDLPELLPPSEK